MATNLKILEYARIQLAHVIEYLQQDQPYKMHTYITTMLEMIKTLLQDLNKLADLCHMVVGH